MGSAAFRRARWERVAPVEVVDQLEAEHAVLDLDERSAACEYVDTHGDDDLRRLLDDRKSPSEPDAGEPSGDAPPKRGRRGAQDSDERTGDGESAGT